MIAITVVLAIILSCGFLGASYLGRVPLGEPRLRMELYPPSPWQLKPGGSLEVAIGTANDGWLLAWAKDVRVIVSAPEGFTLSRTGTHQ